MKLLYTLLALFTFSACAEAPSERPKEYLIGTKVAGYMPPSLRGTGTTYETFQGFTVLLTDEQKFELDRDPNVDYVVEDHLLHIAAFSKENNDLPPDDFLSRINRGEVRDSDGYGVEAAILDTGIESSHPAVRGRVVGGVLCAEGASQEDDHSHGTFVSSEILAVAPDVRLWSVKVLSAWGTGSVAQIICGIDFVARNSPARGGNITIVNMSLGGFDRGPTDCDSLQRGHPLREAICNLSKLGVTVVVAAGNFGSDARTTIPAHLDGAVITVSSYTDTDGKDFGYGYPYTDEGSLIEPDDSWSTFSNYGKVVDIGAPGRNIRGAVLGGEYDQYSGTSMSTPIIVGVVALIQQRYPGIGWKDTRDMMVRAGTYATIKNTAHNEPVIRVKPEWLFR